MFTTLHELAKKATLMITVAAEGDGQVRVNVTPMPFDTKAKSNLPQPLSLLATPTEFDADFIAALSTWQAPKRSLIQQAKEAAGGAAVAPAAALPAPKASAKNESTEKAGRKARAGKADAKQETAGAPVDHAAGGEQQPDAGVQAIGDTTNTDAAAIDEAMPAGAASTTADARSMADEQHGAALAGGALQVADEAAGDAGAAAPAGEGEPAAPAEAADAEAVDKFTLDLF